MEDFVLQNEGVLRLSVFAGILATMMLAEFAFPRKARTQTRRRRWTTNLLIILIDSLVVRIIFPVVAVGVAVFATHKGWGLFNLINTPVWLEIILAILILDMMIYWQHVLSHHIPVLWAMHKVHHADRDIDVTTGSRFHPLEIILSMAYKMALVLILGAPVIAVIIFEIILNACAMFNHSNVKLPLWLDAGLRRFIVTPDMHRVHHSVHTSETNSNYGFSTSLWDRIFSTYTAQPRDGHDKMKIGLDEYQSSAPSSLSWSLFLPVKAARRVENWF